MGSKADAEIEGIDNALTPFEEPVGAVEIHVSGGIEIEDFELDTYYNPEDAMTDEFAF